ncbi:MAG: DUF4440 domain-containing protein, partial [Armatimonadetes bacterium]|nr:DUF4440 domain-containing protein [Armatimonadota bacterium]
NWRRHILLHLVMLAVSILALCGGRAAAEGGGLAPLANVQGYELDGRVLVPVRAISEWLGAAVHYEAGLIDVKRGDTCIRFHVGDNYAELDGRGVDMSRSVEQVSGVAYAPIKFIARALGARVTYVPRPFSRPYLRLESNGRAAKIPIGDRPGTGIAELLSSAGATAGIEKAYYNWVSAWEGRQLRNYLSYYAEDAEVVRSGGRRYNKSALKQRMAQNFAKNSYISINSGIPSIQIYGDRATLRVYQAYRSPTWHDTGTKILTWRCSDLGWKIVHESFEEAVVTLGGPLRKQLAPGGFAASRKSDVYHYPTCRYVRQIKATNLIYFDSAAEARASGYRPCKVCKPPW